MRGHKNFKAAWYQTGLILMKIRDDGDYKEIYGTFKNYIEERWGFNEKQGYRLLNAAELTQKIAQISSKNRLKSNQIGDVLPQNESQLRPLLDTLKTDSERVTVWQNVVEASKNEGVKITAAFVQEKVDEFIASGEVMTLSTALSQAYKTVLNNVTLFMFALSMMICLKSPADTTAIKPPSKQVYRKYQRGLRKWMMTRRICSCCCVIRRGR